MKTTQLHIPEPCSADWAAMTGDEKRKFCDACAKHVHDLSAMTLREAEAVLEADRESGHLCVRYAYDAKGDVRFRTRRVQASAPAWQLSGAVRLTAAAAAMLMVTGISELMSATQALAQTPPNPPPQLLAGGIAPLHPPMHPPGMPSPWNTPGISGPRVNPNKQEILDRLANEAGEGSAEACEHGSQEETEIFMGEAPAMEPTPALKSLTKPDEVVDLDLQLQVQERAAALRLGQFGLTLEEEEIVPEDAP